MAEFSIYTDEEWEEWRGSRLTKAYIDRLKRFKAELQEVNAVDAPNWDGYLVNKGQIVTMNDIIEDVLSMGKEK